MTGKDRKYNEEEIVNGGISPTVKD